MQRRIMILGCAMCLSLLGLSVAIAQAQEKPITIGRIIALSGPAGAKGAEQEAALQAYFGEINKTGGVNGRSIQLKTIDEGDTTKISAAAKLLDEQYAVLTYFLIGGTPGSEAVMKYASEQHIPFVAPNSGAQIFHQPVNPYVFNLRAKYQDEVMAGVRHFNSIGQNKVALLHMADAFGRDGLAGFKLGVEKYKAQSVYIGEIGADKDNVANHLPALLQAAPDAVIMIGPSKVVASFIKSAREQGVIATFMTLSNNASKGFLKELGEAGRGVIVSQVTPPPSNHTSKLSSELAKLLEGKDKAEFSYAAMEAYASAKLLVEALKRAGRAVTRESLVKTLESIKQLDLGGMEVGFGPNDRTGSTYVELTIVGRDGRFVR